jgi:hypothetical protein
MPTTGVHRCNYLLYGYITDVVSFALWDKGLQEWPQTQSGFSLFGSTHKRRVPLIVQQILVSMLLITILF